MKKSNNIILFTLALLVFNSPATFAQSYSQTREKMIHDRLKQTCENPPKINFMSKLDNMHTDFTLNYSQLSRKNSQLLGQSLYGLYLNQTGLKTDVKIGEFTLDNKFCHFVSEINILLQVQPSIFIAKEIMSLACIRHKVWIHEMKHHEFFMHAIGLEEYNTKFEIQQNLKKISAIYNDSQAPVKFSDYITKITSTAQRSLLNKVNDRKAPYDKNIDRPENARKELMDCPQQELAILLPEN